MVRQKARLLQYIPGNERSVNLRQKILLYLIKAYISSKGKHNQAIVYFDKALNRNPSYADALHDRTESLSKRKMIGTDTAN
jgi:tetratricopeptide (TPR) repeat protein